ncbi:DUF945 domain-containing protein [Aliarcobacter butzleri]|uniref:DUF932 domain-containing protein n=1 Tax=Aliarcobacter butzleri TaxID=28197 RepID=UPI00125FE7E8|nr:DUF932 domain-containing protein [Aliarcobacter butzleri]MCT7553016.1 DUF945 domain-containing protein [Aliarcobacter butzleri]MCT7553707.1 DUF945 domain-containing protein [Aliarcobacter butzleri]MCT7557527.1 DUF945 domain-containing protein [Aliarcobacter butzleri]MCT7563377.1 DUF945 domain-containing protein [Aliarcobacter butzleri]MDK2065531.1 DUF932 domain-containing protein [Aliarcobacter butzleri]
MSVNPLNNQELKELAPTLFTREPHYEVSDKYHFIPTIEVIEQIKSHNWYPVSVSQADVRDEEKQGYQQHCVRFRHFEDLLNPQDNAVELLLFNSHDRSKSFSISAGIYRFVCANGLVVSDSVFESYKIKHIGDRDNDVANAVAKITAIKDKLLDKIKTLSNIQLSNLEKQSFAKLAIPLRFEEHLEVNLNDLLVPNRKEDYKDDLYTTLNTIQEHLIRGNVSGINKETGRRFKSKEIKSITNDTHINKGLWDIAEKIAFIKEPNYQIAA